MTSDLHEQWLNETLVELRIREIKKKCGDCSKWMTRRCPRETGAGWSGRSTGPSMNAYPCYDFEPNANFAAMLEVMVMKKLES